MSQKKQPGVMLYFDLRPSLRRMTNEEKGILFESMRCSPPPTNRKALP